MCGRFTQQLTWRQIRNLYHLSEPTPRPDLLPRYNGAPAQEFVACRLDETGNRAIAKLRWGLVPSWAKDVRMGVRLINARAETIPAKPSFNAAFRSRRCLVPANGWFEWQQTGCGKQPYFLTLADGSLLSFAACASVGTTVQNPSNPSPSLPRQSPQNCPTFTIDSRQLLLRLILPIGSIRPRRQRGFSSWCVHLTLARMSDAPSVLG